MKPRDRNLPFAKHPSPNIRGRSDNTDKVVISSEYFEDPRPSYICSICNQTLIRLTDSSLQNTAWWCRNCSVEYDTENENVRRESKLSVPDRNIEPAAASIDVKPDVSIRKEVELKGGFKELANKGIRIKDYHEDIPKPRRR